MGIKNWKEFKVGELFTLERGKEPSPKRVKDGVLPMINEINENNGIAKQGESESIFKKNAITISVNYASNVFYQPEEFIASVNILIIRNEWSYVKI
ncbi:n-6 DNA Methylase family [Firmicutes bacterium CAG:424]|nr:n-6 DNA Methylase family [Firmicutes bacterium CAG:424]